MREPALQLPGLPGDEEYMISPCQTFALKSLKSAMACVEGWDYSLLIKIQASCLHGCPFSENLPRWR